MMVNQFKTHHKFLVVSCSPLLFYLVSYLVHSFQCHSEQSWNDSEFLLQEIQDLILLLLCVLD